MKINCDVLRYILTRHHWHIEIFHYDSSVLVEMIRHYDSGCCQEHALYILQEPWSLELPDMPESEAGSRPSISALPGNCILLYIFPSDHKKGEALESCLAAAFPCPLICVYTDHVPALLNTLQDVFETFRAHSRILAQLCMTSHSYQDLIDCCDDLLEDPVSLIDKSFTYVAYSREKSLKRGFVRDMVENGRVASQTVAQLMITPGFEFLEEKKGVFEFADENFFIGRNIFYENTYVGRLVTIYTSDFIQNTYQEYILECLGQYVERMYRREGSFYFKEAPALLLHTLLPAALGGQPPKSSDWQLALEQKNWKTTDSFCLMTFQAAYRHEKQIHPDYLCPQFEHRWPWVIAATWCNEAVVLINWSHIPEDFEQQLAYFLRDNLLTAGISRSFRDGSGLKAAYLQTQIAIKMGLRLHPHLWYYFFGHYTLDYLKEQCLAELPPETLRHPALTLLLEYDEQHGTELYRSLYIYMDSRFNMSQAAGRMYVHRTTFIKRLQHIEQLTGLNLKNWDTRMYLMLSYQWMGSAKSKP